MYMYIVLYSDLSCITRMITRALATSTSTSVSILCIYNVFIIFVYYTYIKLYDDDVDYRNEDDSLSGG